MAKILEKGGRHLQCLCLPSAGRTAGKYEAGGRYRKTDLIGVYNAAKLLFDRAAQHVGKNGGSQSGGIGVNEEKQRIIGQKLRTELD